MTAQTVLIECPDRKGLIHVITAAILQHGLNIVSNSEFVDHGSGRFFMRTEVEGELDADRLRTDLTAALPEGALVRLPHSGQRRIVVLATSEYHCLGDLLLRNAFGDFNATIAAVIANRDTLGPLVRRFDVPFHHVSHENLSRDEHDQQLLAAIAAYDPEYLILAKYMRVLGPAFITRYRDRIINIHHSFLPAFVGARPYQQAFDRGVKIIGATAHFVTEVLDEGPIIAQSVIPVDHTYSVEDMAQAGRDVEKTVLAQALKLVFDDRVFLCGQRTVIFA